MGIPYEHRTLVPFKGKTLDPAKRYARRYGSTPSTYYKKDFGTTKGFITFGNKKLASHIGVWDLPAGGKSLGGTCGRECRNCFAIRDAHGPHGEDVQVKRFRNLDISLQPFFVKAVIEFLSNYGNKLTAVRVHSSGDFYSQAYVDKWVSIANFARKLSTTKHIKFYAYTKRMGQFDFEGLLKAPNFILIDSFGWTDDNGTPMLNYGDIDYLGQFVSTRHGKDTMVCPCGLDETITGKEYKKLPRAKKESVKICGISCTYCQTKEAQKWPTVFLEH